MKIKYLFSILLCFPMFLSQAQIKVAAPNGFVGLGISSPARQLHVQGPNGIFRLDRSGDVGFLLARYTSNNFAAAPASTYFVGASIRGGERVFEINDLNGAVGGAGIRAVLVDDDGGLVVGPDVVSTAHRLHVVGSAFKTDGQTGWTVASDKRLKQNIEPFDGGMSILKQIKPVQYEYNGKGGTIKGQKRIGVIAQELKNIAPDMVEELTVKIEDGPAYIDDVPGSEGVVSRTEEYLGINTSSLQWILVNAVKEQQKIIEEQAKRIDALEKKIK